MVGKVNELLCLRSYKYLVVSGDRLGGSNAAFAGGERRLAAVHCCRIDSDHVHQNVVSLNSLVREKAIFNAYKWSNGKSSTF